jgi:hypothetical protein
LELVSAGVPFVNKDKPWTDAVRRILHKWGEELGMETHHELATRGTEKLFDLIWFRNGRMKLAVESEWNRRQSEIEYDFEKLMYGKVPLKVCIHTRQSREEELLQALERLLSGHRSHVEGEEYVVIRMTDNKRQRAIHGHVFRVPKVTDGTLDPSVVKFVPVSNSPFPWGLTGSGPSRTGMPSTSSGVRAPDVCETGSLLRSRVFR